MYTLFTGAFFCLQCGTGTYSTLAGQSSCGGYSYATPSQTSSEFSQSGAGENSSETTSQTSSNVNVSIGSSFGAFLVVCAMLVALFSKKKSDNDQSKVRENQSSQGYSNRNFAS
jgi:hypothetical protein